jgi:hypothetical protein
VELHTGTPGSDGTLNVSQVDREELTFASPASGAIALTGGEPSWSITDTFTITAISLWSGFDGDNTAMCLFTLPAQPPVTVADGDVLLLNACGLEWLPAAEGLWRPVGLVEPPTMTATAVMLIPTASGSAHVTAPVMTSTATMLVPFILFPPPVMTSTATMLVPTVSGSANITAPLMTSTATMLVPTVSATSGVPNGRQVNVSVSRASTF